MFKKLKNKKGFTLVELIVVLVILAILAALLVPALTGYIDKANKEKVVVEARMAVMAAQTEASSLYGKAGAGNKLASVSQDDLNAAAVEAVKLAEMKSNTVGAAATLSDDGKVESAVYTTSLYTVVYDGDYTVYNDSEVPSSVTKATANVFTIKVNVNQGKTGTATIVAGQGSGQD